MPKRSSLTEKIRSEMDLLQRHVRLLRTVKERQPIGIIRLSEMLGLPQHKVRYTLRVLEQEGLVKPSPDGAVVTERLNSFLAELRGLMEDMGRIITSMKDTLR